MDAVTVPLGMPTLLDMQDGYRLRYLTSWTHTVEDLDQFGVLPPHSRQWVVAVAYEGTGRFAVVFTRRSLDIGSGSTIEMMVERGKWNVFKELAPLFLRLGHEDLSARPPTLETLTWILESLGFQRFAASSGGRS
jgi:hypothetical protein